MKQTMKRCASLFLALVLILQLFAAVPVSAADPDTGVDITSGVTYTETTFENTDAQNCNAFLITVDTEANSDLTFVAGSPNDERPLTEGLCQTTSAQAQEAYLNGRNVVAAINADFFNINDDSQIQPTGLMIQDGVELTPYYEFSGPDDPERDIRVFFGVKEDGTVVLGDETTYEEVKDELYQAVGGRYWLVRDGEVETYDGGVTFETERAPRTAVGIREDGSVILAVIDGRGSGGSAGTTLAETAQFMVDQGAVTAINLDGGGSSTAVVKDPETRSFEVMNVPSDGKERPVGNTLLVVDNSETAGGVELDQDSDGYYLLKTADDFQEILDGPGENYRLANDVDFSGTENFSINLFGGNFDGDGHTIENLTANTQDGYALFDYVSQGATIQDVKLEDVEIHGAGSNTAALARVSYGAVEGVSVTGTIEGTTNVGGIVGLMEDGGSITSCSVGAAMSGSDNLGGIVGRMNPTSTVDGCYVNVDLRDATRAGGIVGYADGSSVVTNCIATGSISTAAVEPGGIGGLLKVGVNHCIVSDMDITAMHSATTPKNGNVTGFLGAWVNGSQPYTQNVIVSGSITTGGVTEAHRIGYHDNNKSENYCGPAVQINGKAEEGGAANNRIGADATAEQLQDKSFWEGLGFDFETTFAWNEDTKTVSLQNVDMTVEPPASDFALEQDEDGYYLITTAEEFAQIAYAPTAKFRLAGDLDLEGTALASITYFDGELDGQNHTISGLNVDAAGASYALFANLGENANVHDLALKDVQIRNGGGSYTAVLAGSCQGTVENVTVTGRVNGGTMTGGIVGNLMGTGKLLRCSVGAEINGSEKVGGLAGQVTGTVEACYSNCRVYGAKNVGGITGYALDNAGGTRLIQNCIVEGSVSSSDIEAGGIAGLGKVTMQNNLVRNMDVSTTCTGEADSGNVAGLLGAWMRNTPCAVTHNVVLSGSVTAPAPAAGYRLGSSNNDQIADNYANPAILINGQAAEASRDNGTDLTEEQMNSKEFYAGIGFDFERVFQWDDETKTISLQNVDQTVTPPAPSETVEQTNISLSVGADESQRNLTWYASGSVFGKVLVAESSKVTDGKMPADAATFEAASNKANEAGMWSNQVTIKNLQNNTEYAYQLVNGSTTSEIYTFTTGTGDDFSFAFVGDPQIGAGSTASDIEGWAKTLGIVAEDEKFETVDFLLSAGDQVNSAADEIQYNGYLDHEVLTGLTSATVVGNHDTSSNAYDQHFNVPNESELGKTNAGGDYWFTYNDVLFLVLNSNNLSTDEHKAFMEQAIEEAGDVSWKIVAFHHSVYSVANHATESDILQRRNELVPVFQELDIDVVLMGHDHVYVRTYMMDGLEPMTDTAIYDDEQYSSITDPTGILYVTANSASGSKFYTIQSQSFDYAAVQGQENIPNVSRVDVSDTEFTITTYRTSDMSVVDTFTIHRTQEEPQNVIEGYENGEASLDVTEIGRYDSGMTNGDGGVMEIVDYNETTGYAYAINGQTGRLSVIPMEDLESGETIEMLKGTTIDVKSLVEVDGFTYGDMTSVAVSPDGSTLAAAIQAEGYADTGRVALFTCNADGSLTFEKAVEVGVQPDMVTFTPDGTKILTANEGEPRQGYGEGITDPAGSVTIIDTATGTANTVGFTAFDGEEQRAVLVEEGIILQKNTAPSVDLEPEYIACTDTTAYVTLQEANAIAVLDLASGTYTGIYSAGFEDYSKTPVDIDKEDETYAPKTYQGLKGIRMPDGIALYTVNGVDYLLTANEGDAREWGDEDLGTYYLNEDERNFKDGEDTSPTGNITADNSGLTGKVVFFATSDYDGLDENTDYLFGGRTFTLYRVDSNGLTEVFTSGDDFESNTAKYLPDYFNCSNDDLSIDDRSGKKGPEPETVVTGTVDGKTYAFVTLERIGGVMVYDITDPANVSYVNYINSRDFSADVAADDSPEGLKFVAAEESPTGKALLLAACEVGGTVAVYELESNETPDGGSGSGGSTSGGNTNQPDQNESSFTDVKSTDWYAEAVEYVVENGLMNGTSETTFAPNGQMTRAMVVTVLARMAGVDTTTGSNWYEAGRLWAMEQGISDGTNMEDSITREQLVTMLYRYAGEPEVSGSVNGYTDAGAISDYAANAMAWAVEEGILNGMNDGTLQPQGTATRAQVAAMLMRFEELAK